MFTLLGFFHWWFPVVCVIFYLVFYQQRLAVRVSLHAERNEETSGGAGWWGGSLSGQQRTAQLWLDPSAAPTSQWQELKTHKSNKIKADLFFLPGCVFGAEHRDQSSSVKNTDRENGDTPVFPGSAHPAGPEGDRSEGAGRLWEEAQWLCVQQPGSSSDSWSCFFSGPFKCFCFNLKSVCAAPDVNNKERSSESSLSAPGLWGPEKLCFFWQGEITFF